MVKTIIIEDEKKSREMLQKLIELHCKQLTVIGTAGSMKEGLELLKKQTPDLLFLDIELGDGTGFDLIEQTENKNFKVIFATAYDQYAIKAIKYSALDYLLKPYDVEELVNAVNKITDSISKISEIENIKFLLSSFKKQDEQQTKITLPTGNAYEIVNIKDIIRCEADGSYTKFFLTGNKTYLVTQSLKHYEELLPEEFFVRIHHHHLINMDHVVRYLKEDSGYAVMSDNTQVEISRRKKELFMERLNKNKR